MREPIQGKNKVVLFRAYDLPETSGAMLALQTDHEIGETQALNTLQTKDGEIIIPGGLSTRVTINAVVSDDPINELLRYAVREGKLLEFWEADLSKKEIVNIDEDNPDGDTVYSAWYGKGYLASWTAPNPVSGFATLSTEFYVIGKLVQGNITLDASQMEEIETAFVDIVPQEGR